MTESGSGCPILRFGEMLWDLLPQDLLVESRLKEERFPAESGRPMSCQNGKCLSLTVDPT